MNIYKLRLNLNIDKNPKNMSFNKDTNLNFSQAFSSETSDILSKLQKKISKYLSPSYDDSQNVFDKSKTVKQDHRQAIEDNKQFIKSNQKQQFQKHLYNNWSNQFDQLLQRRSKCQAKLHKMLFDHQLQQDLRLSYSMRVKPQNSNEFRIQCHQYKLQSNFYKTQSNKNTGSPAQKTISINSPGQSEPNFLIIEKQLKKMQKKLNKLENKVIKSSKKSINTNCKSHSKSKISQIQKETSLRQKQTSFKSQIKLKSVKSSQNLFNYRKAGSFNKFITSEKDGDAHQQFQYKQKDKSKRKIQNLNSICKKNKPNDQTSLVSKLKQNKSQRNLESNKALKICNLKKVGITKYNGLKKSDTKERKQGNQCSPKKVQERNPQFDFRNGKEVESGVKCAKQQQKKSSKGLQRANNKSQNHIKLALTQFRSENIL